MLTTVPLSPNSDVSSYAAQMANNQPMLERQPYQVRNRITALLVTSAAYAGKRLPDKSDS